MLISHKVQALQWFDRILVHKLAYSLPLYSYFLWHETEQFILTNDSICVFMHPSGTKT